MATIHPSNRPASRIAAGDHVLEAAKTADTRAVKAKLAAFARAHAALVAAHAVATKAEMALHDAQDAVGDADAEQDAAVHALAAKMVGDGAPKANPFNVFGLAAPSVVAVTAVEKEVALTAKLATLASKWKSATIGTKQAAALLAKKSAGTKKALADMVPMRKAQAAAIAKRDALGVPWARAFAHLKNAARTAEDDGARGLYAALFGVTAAPRARAARKVGGAEVPPAAAAEAEKTR